MSTAKETIVIGGLPTHVYGFPFNQTSSRPIATFFLLHGRTGSAEAIDNIAKSIIAQAQDDSNSLDLLIITFDQRNHGERLVYGKANEGWSREPEKQNDRHAIDMYSIQTGTTRDVSFLIDFLPSYLFPKGERTIIEWGVAGISLGGHVAWLGLCQDARIKTGIPIIGCPDYMGLMKQRAEANGIPFSPPYIPETLVALVKHADPAWTAYSAQDSSNPFLGKRILVLSGGADRLVPWTASEAFVERVNVGVDGVKKVSVHEGVGHACTDKMVEEMATFIKEEVLST